MPWPGDRYRLMTDVRPADEPTQFESEAHRLGLPKERWEASRELREWASRWCRSKYVPEDLLKAWGMETGL